MATAKKKSATPAKKSAPTKKAASPIVKKAAAKKPAPAKAPAPRKLPAPVKAPRPKVDKAEKPKKPKLVRDSFTIPKTEYLVLDELKTRALKLAHPVKKSELLRAGVKALAALGDAAFLAALKEVPAIKTGRPASEK